MAERRLDYIDIAKGLGILTVVWGHIMTSGVTHEVIYAFHMPLFFFLSGMLFRSEKYSSFRSFFLRRGKRLLIPYVIYSVATWTFWVVFRYFYYHTAKNLARPLLQTLLAQGSGGFLDHNSALWFIPCLFLVEMLYYFISKAGLTWSIIICFSLAALSFVLGDRLGDVYWYSLPWNADVALIALPFYAAGNVLTGRVGHSRFIASVSARKWQSALLWLVVTVPFCWAAMVFPRCSMGSSYYPCGAWVFMSRAFFGVAWFMLLSLFLSVIPKRNPVTTIAKRCGIKSLDIMCLHLPLIMVFSAVVARVFCTTLDSIGGDYGYSLIVFVLTIASSWPIIRLIDRFREYKGGSR